MKRKVKFIGHLLGHNDFVINILERKFIGKRPRGITRSAYFNNTNQQM